MSANGKWFVMMYSQNGKFVMPLQEDDDVKLWNTENEAKTAAAENPYANAFGFQAYEVGG